MFPLTAGTSPHDASIKDNLVWPLSISVALMIPSFTLVLLFCLQSTAVLSAKSFGTHTVKLWQIQQRYVCLNLTGECCLK